MMKAKISRYLSLPFVVTVTYWVLDHLLPDFLPELPKTVSLAIVACAATLLLVAFIIMGWRRLLTWIPRPWIPRPFWRTGFWLCHRPSVSIITVAPQASVVDGRMDECIIRVTLWRNLSRLPCEAIVRIDAATLTLRRDAQREATRHVFRPKEAGGFLVWPMAAGSIDTVLIEFAATGLPARLADAPDFDGDYEIEIAGIRVDAKTSKPFAGELPPVRWQMCRAAYQAHLAMPVQGSVASL